MVVALLPGGFKPPHAGHYEAAKYLADYADKVLIKIGPSNRGGGLKYEPLGIDVEGGVTPEIAKEFWEEYIKYDSDPRKNKIEIELSSLDTPVRDVYDYIENPPNDVSKVVLGLGEKESGTRYQGVPKAAQASNIEYEIVKIPPQAGGASGSATRDFIITQNEKDFINSIPKFLPDEVKDGMWNLLTQRVKLSSEKEKELKKKISSHKSKVRRALKKKLQEFNYGKLLFADPKYKGDNWWGDITTAIYGDNTEVNTKEEEKLANLIQIYVSKNANPSELGPLLPVLLKLKKKFPRILDPTNNELSNIGSNSSKFTILKTGDVDKKYPNYAWRGTTISPSSEEINSLDSKPHFYLNNNKIIENPNINITPRGGYGFTSFTTSAERAKAFSFNPAGYSDEKPNVKKIYVLYGVKLDNPNFILNPWFLNEVGGMYENETFYVGNSISPDIVVILDDVELKTNFAIDEDIKELMGGTMNAEEMAKHMANMKKLKKYFSQQGDQMVPIPRKYTKGLRRKLYERDPKVGTGKKPKGSGRRLYTDENPKDTVSIKFSSRQDIVDTLNKKSFKSKSHARQSQIINLIHQRVRAAHGRAKDPAVKKRLKTALDYITKRKEASKEKTQRMRKEGLFSKDWWLDIITEEILYEGGAAGHMAHPFDLPQVKTGKDLIKSFEQAADSLKKTPGSVKIDGVNASIRLVNFDGKREFAMDRGSKKALDLRGVTKADLEDRFGAGHGMIKAGGDVLDIFNNALPSVQEELEALGLIDDPNIMFNMEYVSGKSNIQDYGKNFLAIHGLLSVETKEVQGARKMLTKRVTTEKSFDKADMDELLKKLEPFAKKKGFEIYGSVPTTFTKDPDFKSALNTKYTIDFAEGDQTKTLGEWLNQVTNIPLTDRVKMNVNGTIKDVGALSKQVYFAIFGGENVDDLFDSEQDQQKAIQGAITYLATEKLGDAILDVLDSPMGSVNDHEGVVIRDDKISPKPFKITGKFITGGVSSDFQKK